jgi:hypothetical protein
MNAYDINTLQDITAQSAGLYRERLVDHPINEYLISTLPPVPNDEPNLLQVGKMYLNTQGHVEEYSGKLKGQLHFRQWSSQSKAKTVKVGHLIQPTNYKIRTAASCHELVAQVHCLTEENLDGTTHGIRAIAIQPEKYPTIRSPNVNTPITRATSGLFVFTDGGRKHIASTRQLVFGEQFEISSDSVLLATGAIVAVRNNIVENMIAVDGFSNKISDVQSFEAEEVPIIAALQLLGEDIRGATIFTDSESTYKKLQRMRWKSSADMKTPTLLPSIDWPTCLMSQYRSSTGMPKNERSKVSGLPSTRAMWQPIGSQEAYLKMFLISTTNRMISQKLGTLTSTHSSLSRAYTLRVYTPLQRTAFP